MIQLPTTLLEPPAPPPASHGDPPGDPGRPFSTVLDDHQARTAVAEGQQREDTAPAVPPARRERDDRDEDDRAPRKADAEGDAPVVAVAALLGTAPAPATVAAAARASASAAVPGQAEPGPLGGRVLTVPGARTPVSDRGTCVLTATRPIGVPGSGADVAHAFGAAAAPGSAPAGLPGAAPVATPALSPSMTLGQGSAPAEGDTGAAGAAAGGQARAPAAASRLASALQAASGTSHGGPTAGSVPPPASAAAAAAARTAPAVARGAVAQPHQAAPAPTPAAAPTDAPTATATDASAAASPVDAARGVGLDHAVETVRLALRAAAERGVTHARISLNPRELGSIEVHLRQSADGLVARVVAQHGAAAQLLQHAGAELRRALESQGLNVLRLDIGASGEQAGDRARERAFAHDAAGRDGHSGARAGDAPLDGAPGPATTTTTLALSNGALIDVLA